MIAAQDLKLSSHWAGAPMIGGEPLWEIRTIMALDWKDNLLVFASTVLPENAVLATTTIGEFARWARREILPQEISADGIRAYGASLR